ncbi:unnamed protein product [Owenia fusiformis]|uniref:Uncharacterized protein n=1 Tax=Owenia fusiformis TaxID=6347 RepID=A0A8J1XLH7_OWEFU|nr:unnamed protein product [Owenia fusiformis]
MHPNLPNLQRIQLSPHHVIPGRRFKRAVMPILCVLMFVVLIVKDRPPASAPEHHTKKNSEDIFGLAKKSFVDGIDEPTLNTPATHKLITTLRGSFFLGGNGQKIVSSQIKTSLLYTFYPDVTDSVRAMFPNVRGPNTPNQYFVISPAIAFYKGEIWTLLRVWLNYERLKDTKEKQYNVWQDNYLYMQRFNNEMNPTSYGSLLGIPVPKQYMRNAGTGDPRIFEFKGDLYAFYYMPMNVDGKEWGNMFMWNLNKNYALKPQIPGFEMNKIDSNWSPFVKDDKLYFLYSYDPVRILQCTDKAECHFIGDASGISNAPFDWKHNCLRGGTPFQVYEYPYYIAIAHTRVLTRKGESFYGVHLVILNVDTFRVLYVFVQQTQLCSKAARQHGVQAVQFTPFCMLYRVNAVQWFQLSSRNSASSSAFYADSQYSAVQQRRFMLQRTSGSTLVELMQFSSSAV